MDILRRLDNICTLHEDLQEETLGIAPTWPAIWAVRMKMLIKQSLVCHIF